tara:strand:+ start:423 stop:1316 length:894 start_codon:yes stop_codon:yes gene_type:complete
MNKEKKFTSLRNQLAKENIIVAPGCYDAFSAMLIENAGFTTAYITGASIAYTRLGRPDIGLVSMSEVVETVYLISERTQIPLIVDGDTGFGNALNVIRTVRAFEAAGANAIQLEDQTLPKRCGHLKGKSLVSAGEMIGKIKAAVDSRRSEDFLIMARTDAIAVEGFEKALERAEKYCEAGADILFIEAPENEKQQAEIPNHFNKLKVPLLANMVEGGSSPLKSASELERLGYSIVIFPGGLIRAFTHMATEYFSSLKKNGSNKDFQDRMLDFKELNQVLETDRIMNIGQNYDASKWE